MTSPSREWADLRPRLLATTTLCLLLIVTAAGASGDEIDGASWQWGMAALSVVVFGAGAWAMVYLWRGDR